MKPKIVEILTKILEGLSGDSSMEDINRSLLESKKYDEHTLGIAFSLLYDKLLFKRMHGKDLNPKRSNSIRFLTTEEKEILGANNYNYIMHLINVGLINADVLEIILEQISIYPENSITRKEINWMILLSLVDFDNDVPSGSRVLLYTSDSVN